MKENNLQIIVAEIGKDILFIKDTLRRLENSMDEMKETFVTKEEFKPVRSIAYGMIGFIAVAVLGAIVDQILLH